MKNTDNMETRPLTTKQKAKLAAWTGWISFFAGWALTITNFFLPPMGEIADSTLFVLGQSLLYVGAIIGITSYAKAEVRQMKREIGIEPDDETE